MIKELFAVRKRDKKYSREVGQTEMEKPVQTQTHVASMALQAQKLHPT